MKNNLYFDADFNFLLLECEESSNNSIYLVFHTSEAANQVLKISVDGGTEATEALESDADINILLDEAYWAFDSETTLVLSNSDGESDPITINFPAEIETSGSLNLVEGNSFVFQTQEAQNERNADTASKLRSAPVDAETGERFYTYLTEDKNFIVSDDNATEHGAVNDVTGECNIGTEIFPWGQGNFKELKIRDPQSGNVISYDVLPFALSMELLSGDWQTITSTDKPSITYYRQQKTARGIKEKSLFEIIPDDSGDMDILFVDRVKAFCVAENVITFLAERQPASNLSIQLLIEDYKESQINGAIMTAYFVESLNTLYIRWTSPDESQFYTWVRDEIIVDRCLNPGAPGDPSSWENVLTLPTSSAPEFAPNEYATTPFVIGNDPSTTDYVYSFGRYPYRVRIRTTYQAAGESATDYIYSTTYDFQCTVRTELLYDTYDIDVQTEVHANVMYGTAGEDT